MPHFGLMEERKMGPVEGPLMRAKLHIRGGRRRLRQGKIAAGIVTLYDALEAALQAYSADPERRARLAVKTGDDLKSEKSLYDVLVRSRVLDGTFDYEGFNRLTERALKEEIPGYDYHGMLRGVESVMIQLGVMPFDESSLPPEDPKTF
jgi:hypothetical protein